MCLLILSISLFIVYLIIAFHVGMCYVMSLSSRMAIVLAVRVISIVKASGQLGNLGDSLNSLREYAII
jgi:hypothetical protein